jgi:hypothetical protein
VFVLVTDSGSTGSARLRDKQSVRSMVQLNGRVQEVFRANLQLQRIAKT